MAVAAIVAASAVLFSDHILVGKRMDGAWYCRTDLDPREQPFVAVVVEGNGGRLEGTITKSEDGETHANSFVGSRVNFVIRRDRIHLNVTIGKVSYYVWFDDLREMDGGFYAIDTEGDISGKLECSEGQP